MVYQRQIGNVVLETGWSITLGSLVIYLSGDLLLSQRGEALKAENRGMEVKPTQTNPKSTFQILPNVFLAADDE